MIYTYTGPSARIFPAAPRPQASSIYSPDSLRAFFEPVCPCASVSFTDAAQYTAYNFALSNPYTRTATIRAACDALARKIPEAVRLCPSSTSSFCVEIAKAKPDAVYLPDLLGALNDAPPSSCILGSGPAGAVKLDIAAAPHILISGTTGSGKSVLLHSMLVSLLAHSTPASTRLLMIDPKQTELTQYDGIPQLLRPVVTDAGEAVAALEDVCAEMDRRYKAIRRGRPAGAAIYVIVDELADLMLTGKKACEASIVRIAQLGRAAGIHLILATQRPTVNVVTGLIKANTPCRIALKSASVRDSVTILDHKGAEALQGHGDALLKRGDSVTETRFQAAFCRPEDIQAIVKYWSEYQPVKTPEHWWEKIFN